MADQDALTRTLVELADTLVDDFDVVDLLTLLTDRCVEAFDVQAPASCSRRRWAGPCE